MQVDAGHPVVVSMSDSTLDLFQPGPPERCPPWTMGSGASTLRRVLAFMDLREPTNYVSSASVRIRSERVDMLIRSISKRLRFKDGLVTYHVPESEGDG